MWRRLEQLGNFSIHHLVTLLVTLFVVNRGVARVHVAHGIRMRLVLSQRRS